MLGIKNRAGVHVSALPDAARHRPPPLLEAVPGRRADGSFVLREEILRLHQLRSVATMPVSSMSWTTRSKAATVSSTSPSACAAEVMPPL